MARSSSLLVAFALLGACCWTPEPFPFSPDSGFIGTRDAGFRDFRDVGTPDAPPPGPECTVEIPTGAACDEPCIGPVRRVTCPGGLQHLGVALAEGSTWLAATSPPRLLRFDGSDVTATELGLEGEGLAMLVTDSFDTLRIVYADTTLGFGQRWSGTRAPLLEGSAYWVPLGAEIDAFDQLHVLYLDDGAALHLASTSIVETASLTVRDPSPTYFADSALAVGPDGVPHVAFWRHRSPATDGRDLLVVDGDAEPRAIGFTTHANDDGTNVSLAATDTAVWATVDFADGIHVLSPDETTGGSRETVVEGTAELGISGCPEMPPPGPLGDCAPIDCTEAGAGTLRRSHEIVRTSGGRLAMVWLERSVTRDVHQSSTCSEAGCACTATTLSELAETTLVFGWVDESSGLPERTMIVPLGDVETSGLTLDAGAGHLVVAMQDDDLSAVLVDLDLGLLGP